MELMQIFVLLLAVFVMVLFTLICVYIVLLIKNKKEKSKEEDIEKDSKSRKNKTTKNKETSRGSVYDFMDFDEISDNMIIRKKRTQYIMVVRCKGVNYDLMSEEEKISVEQGFVQFLNTLRFPIQLYVQTTSLNLRDIIEEYKSKIKLIEKEIRKIDEQILVARNDEKKTR